MSKAAKTEVTGLQEKLFVEDSLSPVARASHLSNAFFVCAPPPRLLSSMAAGLGSLDVRRECWMV